MIDQHKYRHEYWTFRTKKGRERKMVCIIAGDNERQRMLEKAKKMARVNQWILL